MPLRNKLYVLLLLIFLWSCSGDDISYDIGAYKVDLADVCVSSEGKQFFLLDNNISLLHNGYISKLEQGQRIWLNYSYLEEENKNYNHIIKVNGYTQITTRKLKSLSWAVISSFPDSDPVRLESVWIGNHYLNLIFQIGFHSEKHLIDLFCDESRIRDEELHIYFRHDNNNDPPGAPQKVIISYDLSILGNPGQNKVLYVHIKSDNYGDRVYELLY